MYHCQKDPRSIIEFLHAQASNAIACSWKVYEGFEAHIHCCHLALPRFQKALNFLVLCWISWWVAAPDNITPLLYFIWGCSMFGQIQTYFLVFFYYVNTFKYIFWSVGRMLDGRPVLIPGHKCPNKFPAAKHPNIHSKHTNIKISTQTCIGNILFVVKFNFGLHI